MEYEKMEAPSLEFSGEMTYYDDGRIEIPLPAEFAFAEFDEPLGLLIPDTAIQLVWDSNFFEMEEDGNIDGLVAGQFERLLGDGGVPRGIRLASGFSLYSVEGQYEGDFVSALGIAREIEPGVALAGFLFLVVPVDVASNLPLLAVTHLLRCSIRRAQLSDAPEPWTSSRQCLHLPMLNRLLPESIGDLVYLHTSFYGEELGFSLRFADEAGSRADVYVFTAGEELLEPGLADADTQFEAAFKNIEEVSGTIALSRRGVSHIGMHGIPFHDARGLIRDGETDSEAFTALLVTALRGVFLKVRYTSESESGAEEVLDRFMVELCDILG